jgi:putative SOS response-associated peptidase YedK
MCAHVDQSDLSAVELRRRGMLDEQLQPKADVFPKMPLGVVLRPGPGQDLVAAAASWGLVPARVDDPKAFQKKWATYNARAESVATKNVFAEAFRARRCAVPVDGFFEWTDRLPEGRRYKVAVYGAQPDVLWLAGLWERHPVLGLTATIITCEPNELIGEVHSRMPVVLDSQQVGAWLDQGGPGLLRPYPSERLARLKHSPGITAAAVRASAQAVRSAQEFSSAISKTVAAREPHGGAPPGPGARRAARPAQGAPSSAQRGQKQG